MEDEFNRPSFTWIDWKGVEYNLLSCWEYVGGKAKATPGCTPGTRDSCNDSLSPRDFEQKVNDFIDERRKHPRRLGIKWYDLGGAPHAEMTELRCDALETALVGSKKLGRKWKNMGPNKPHEGRNLTHLMSDEDEKLKEAAFSVQAALVQKERDQRYSEDAVVFSPEELAGFGLDARGLQQEDYLQVLSNYFKPMDVSRFELTREELANALKDCQEAGTGQRLQGVSTSHYIKLPGPHGTYVAPMAVVRHRLTTSHCHLTLDEVKAVRLYSGPAYQPINNFLRQISKVSGKFRDELVSCPTLTFAATVQHICQAIRKLADVNTVEEMTEPLWRGVRGELPNSFWASDEYDDVSAVDTAFMSTSRCKDTAVNYLDEAASNVLWEIYPKEQTDSAFHCGASIKLLSQFELEDEVLFPPFTLIAVRTKTSDVGGDPAPRSLGGASPEMVAELASQPPSRMRRSSTATDLDEEESADPIVRWRKRRMARFDVLEDQQNDANTDGKAARYTLIRSVPSFV